MGLLAYQVLIVPRNRPPIKRPKARKPALSRGVSKATACATPPMMRTLSRSSLASTASGASTASEWSDDASSSASLLDQQSADTPTREAQDAFEALWQT